PPPPPTPAPSRITIKIIAGQGAVNNIGMRVAAQPGVEVLDQNNAPVVDADVMFQAPADGPGGSFFGGMRTYSVKTDAKGQAMATGFIPNDSTGRFGIAVRATAGAAVAEAVVNQSNGQGPAGSRASSSRKGLWTILGVAAVVAIAGGVAASSGGSSTAADTVAKRPVTIGAGPVTVGGPR
ncbi:MAG: hypothetical protein ACKV2U_21895, partial [Bryobacteraceae bacterium]